jgi:hypothetical protein
MSTITYTSPGFRPCLAERHDEAAEIFALRAARKQYGRNAVVGALTAGSHSMDNTCAEYSAFIGYKTRGQNGICGHNIHLTIYTPEYVR